MKSHLFAFINCLFLFPFRIPAVPAHVSTMAPVKLDSPVEVFVVFAAPDSLEQLAMKVMYTDNFCMST